MSRTIIARSLMTLALLFAPGACGSQTPQAGQLEDELVSVEAQTEELVCQPESAELSNEVLAFAEFELSVAPQCMFEGLETAEVVDARPRQAKSETAKKSVRFDAPRTGHSKVASSLHTSVEPPSTRSVLGGRSLGVRVPESNLQADLSGSPEEAGPALGAQEPKVAREGELSEEFVLPAKARETKQGDAFSLPSGGILIPGLKDLVRTNSKASSR